MKIVWQFHGIMLDRNTPDLAEVFFFPSCQKREIQRHLFQAMWQRQGTEKEREYVYIFEFIE